MELLVCNATQTLTLAPSLLGESGVVASLAEVMAPAAASIFCATWMWRVYSKTSGWINRSNLRRKISRAVSTPSRLHQALVAAKPTEAELVQLLFHRIPDEILLHILRQIGTDELLQLCVVNRKWNSMCLESVSRVHISRWMSYWSESEDKPNETGDNFIRHIKSVKQNLTYLSISNMLDLQKRPRALSVIGSAKKLRQLEIDDIKLPKAAFRAIGHCHELRELRLDGDDNFNPHHLAALSQLTQLESLTLSSISVVQNHRQAPVRLDQFFPRLAELRVRYCWGVESPFYAFLPHLNSNYMTTLELSPCRLSDEQAVSISRLTNLTTFKLDSASNFHASVFDQFLPQLTRLSDLSLNRSAVSDSALCNFGKMTNLSSLSLTYCSAIQSTFFSQCSSAHLKLTKLRIEHCGGFDGAALERISMLTDLVELVVSHSSHPGDSMTKALSTLSKLTLLNISDSSLSVLQVSHMTKLVTLIADECSELEHLGELPASIQKLNLKNCIKLKDDALSAASKCSYFTDLDISGLPFLFPNALESLTSARQVYSLYMSNTPVSLSALKSLYDRDCYLRTLDFRGSPTFDDEILKMICTHPKSKTASINIGGCPRLSPQAFKFIAASPTISTLNFGPASDEILSNLEGFTGPLHYVYVFNSGTATVDAFLKAFPKKSKVVLTISGNSFSVADKARIKNELPNANVYN